jgi:hypothetical protein
VNEKRKNNMKLSKTKIDELCAKLLNFESKNVTPRDAKQWSDDISDKLAEYLPDTNFAEVVQRIFIKSWGVFGMILGGESRVHSVIEENTELSFKEKVDSVKSLLRLLYTDLQKYKEFN